MGYFISNEGKQIYYEITDNYCEKAKVICEKEKIGRYIYFYDDKKNLIKTVRIYGTYDEMQNISSMAAKRYFEKNS